MAQGIRNLSREDMDFLFMELLYENEYLTKDETAQLFRTTSLLLRCAKRSLHPTYDLEELVTYLFSQRWITQTKRSVSFVMMVSANTDRPSKKYVDRKIKEACGEAYSAMRAFLADIKEKSEERRKEYIVQLALASTAYELFAHLGMSKDFVEPYLLNRGLSREDARESLRNLKNYLSLIEEVSLEFFAQT